MNLGGFRPLFDRILVTRIEMDSKIGSIIIPDNAKERSYFGRVVAVGKGKPFKNGKTIPLDGVKIGDVVVFGRYSGSDIPDKFRLEDEDCIVLREDEVLGVIDGPISELQEALK